jgi:hypothetical protein
MSPITLSIKIPKIQTRLLPQRDVRSRSGDLPRHERPSSPWTLVVEQDTIASIHAIRLPVVDGNPECVQLRASIWGSRVERGRLTLRRLDDFTVQL